MGLPQEPISAPEPLAPASSGVTLFVCTTCRTPGVSEGEPDGRRLAEAALALPDTPGLTVKPVRCLSNCKRGLSAALIREGGWTYVFGDLTPDSAPDLLTGATLFATSTDGLMPWRGRPDSLKRGMIARVPPLSFCEDKS